MTDAKPGPCLVGAEASKLAPQMMFYLVDVCESFRSDAQASQDVTSHGRTAFPVIESSLQVRTRTHTRPCSRRRTIATHDEDWEGIGWSDQDPRRPKLVVMYVLPFDDSELGLWWRVQCVGI